MTVILDKELDLFECRACFAERGLRARGISPCQRCVESDEGRVEVHEVGAIAGDDFIGRRRRLPGKRDRHDRENGNARERRDCRAESVES